MNLGPNPTASNPAPTSTEAANMRSALKAASFDPVYYFTNAAADGDWTNLANWFIDAGATLAADILPPDTANVVISGELTTLGGTRTVQSARFLYGSSFNMADIGHILTSIEPVVFLGNSGILSGIIYGDGMFIGSGSFIAAAGDLTGTAFFMSTGHTFEGTVSGSAYFSDLSFNQGTVTGTAGLLGEYYAGLPNGMTAGNMLRVATSGKLEERTLAQVITDIAAIVYGSAQTLTTAQKKQAQDNIGVSLINSGEYKATIDPSELTANRILSLPDTAGYFSILTTSLYGGPPVAYPAVPGLIHSDYASGVIYISIVGDPNNTWMPFMTISGEPIAYNATQALYQKITVSGAAGSEQITISDL